MLEDTDGDGKADRITTFHEGLDRVMDIATHPDGSIYVATRNAIHRLRDTNGGGRAEEEQRIIFLDTKGDYPHNGISGLAFQFNGDLYFGLGENLGANYRLIGSDGTTLAGGGEGGNIFQCTADGKQLRRIATGFWNPFGICVDIFGRIFAVENDPDASPPCRLLHIVEGGDYGYQYRYGRSGRHPFQSWNGQLPGTLPMVCGTGEGPCEILSYEADGLPHEYLGNLLVASWADHRVERYIPKEHGASFTAERLPFVQGGKDFRPVGIAVAPDGSLFISDWVRVDYQLHGQGAIWHLKPKSVPKPARPDDPKQALFSLDRNHREAAARKLAGQGEAGRSYLRQQLQHQEPRVRATALVALITADDPHLDLLTIAEKNAVPALRAMAIRAVVKKDRGAVMFSEGRPPATVEVEYIAVLTDLPSLLTLLRNTDPFLRHAAVQRLAQIPDAWLTLELATLRDPRPRIGLLLAERIGLLLAARASGDPRGVARLPEFLRDADEEVRFLAVKWIADEKLAAHRPWLQDAIKDPKLSGRMHFACATALARIDGQDVDENRMAEHFLDRLADPRGSAAMKTLALQYIPAGHRKLTPALLRALLNEQNAELKLAAVRLLCEHPGPQRGNMLKEIVADTHCDPQVRAQALAGLADQAKNLHALLFSLTEKTSAELRDEALRCLVDTPLSPDERKRLQHLAESQPRILPLVDRLLGKPFQGKRPPLSDTDAWLRHLEGPADAGAGRRLFFQAKLTGCCNCHRVEGRGKDIGPDLSTIGRSERRRILESVLQPNASIAPHYQVWVLHTASGKTLTGMLVRTYLDESTYVDNQGLPFTLNTRDIVESKMIPTSLMPDNLVDRLTDQEVRDLLAYLCSLE